MVMEGEVSLSRDVFPVQWYWNECSRSETLYLYQSIIFMEFVTFDIII